MKIQQLKSLLEVIDCGFNVTAAARSLFLAQSAISTQIKQLEDELGAAIFTRSGKRLEGLTPIGVDAVALARSIIHQATRLKCIRDEYNKQSSGTLRIAVSFTIAHRVLPNILKRFSSEFPDVVVTIYQGKPREAAELLISGKVDLCISTDVSEDYPELTVLPCYTWNLGVIVPHGHALSNKHPLTLDQIKDYRIVTYDASVHTNHAVHWAFRNSQLTPNITVMASDPYTIKRYVKLGLGIGIIGDAAFEKQDKAELQFIDARHLFPSGQFCVALRNDSYLRRFAYRFIELYAPDWTREKIDATLNPPSEST